jgi:uncharacterized membrane protein
MSARLILPALLLAGLIACSPEPAPAASAPPAAPAVAEAAVDPNAKLDGDLTFASTTPFWSATVTGSEHKIDVKRPMRDPDIAAKVAFKSDANTASFTGTTEKDGDVTLTVERKPCRPKPTEPAWPFSSTLTIEGGTFKGCAAPGQVHVPR